MKYRYLLLDLDGTLVDSYHPLVHTINETLSSHGLAELTNEELQGGLTKIYHRRSHESDPDMLRQTHLKLQHNHLHKARVYPHVIETLRTLRTHGVTCAVVTTCNIAKARVLLETHDLHKYMDVVITEADVINVKPHREPFDKAVHALKVTDLSKVLMVGDGGPDIEGAKAYGIDVAAVTYSAFGIDVKSYDPTYLIDSFDELLPIVGVAP